MKIISTPLPDLIEFEPKVFGDHRGYFLELWHQNRYEGAGLGAEFVQDNLSYSGRGVLRGMHLQFPNPQGKLVTVLEGEVFDAAVDLRVGSPTFGKWHGVVLSGKSKNQIYVPPGFAHGFLVTSDMALFHYKCTDFYNPANEVALAFDDPDVGIKWPDIPPSLSEKDKKGLRLKDLPRDRLVKYAR